jgi:hypothetical protein
MPELAIDPDKVCYLIVRARQFDVKVEPVIPDSASDMADDGAREVLEDRDSDPVAVEITQFVESLDEDERATLVALMWLGRGDYAIDEWDSIVEEAREREGTPTASYLMGTPLLADYLEEGLEAFGKSCEDFEEGRL